MASPVSTWIAKGVARTLWEGVTTSSTTNGAETAAGLPDKTIYVTGNFQSATIVTIEGSNNTATGPYVDCVDPQGNAIAFSADGQEVILENPQFIRPRVSGATGGSDIDVIMISRGAVR